MAASTTTSKVKFTFYVGLVILAALAYSFNMLMVHLIGKSIPSNVFVLQSNAGMVLVTGILCAIFPNPISSNDINLPLVGGLGLIVITGYISQKCTVIANSSLKPSLVMPFGYLSILVAFVTEYFIFGTYFSWTTIIGMILTSLGLLGNFLSENDDRSTNK